MFRDRYPSSALYGFTSTPPLHRYDFRHARPVETCPEPCNPRFGPNICQGQLSSAMTHKYRKYIVILLINKNVEPNEEQKVLTSGFDQGFTVNTSKRVFRGIL
jgi:hypothetical protein